MKIKKILLLTVSATLIAGTLTGCSIFRNDKKADEALKSTNNSSELVSGQYYVWHDEETSNIENDVGTDTSKFKKYNYNIFRPVYQENAPNQNLMVGDSHRVSMMLAQNDDNIPTLYKGDELIYVSDSDLPESFKLERFYDHGYTIGLFGLSEYIKNSENYALDTSNTDNIGYKMDSSADKLATAIKSEGVVISIPYIGDKKITSKDISRAGTIKGLLLNSEYDTSVYIGSERHILKLKADTRVFSSYEQEFPTNNYSFVGQNIITIKLPEYLKTGYYNINGAGIFRYVAEGDSYDNTTNFNDPIIITDDDGNIIYNPVPDETLDENKDKNDNTDIINESGSVSSIKKSILVENGQSVRLEVTFKEIIDVTQSSKVGIKYYKKETGTDGKKTSGDENTPNTLDTSTSDDATQSTEITITEDEAKAGRVSRDISGLEDGTWIFEITGLNNYKTHSEIIMSSDVAKELEQSGDFDINNIDIED